MHQYFDQGFSGTADICTAADDAVAALSSIARWARTNHVKLFLGEFGVSQRSECVAALDRALTVLHDDRDVWYGYAYWSAGAWWGSYPFNIQVTGGTPQGTALKTHAAACPG